MAGIGWNATEVSPVVNPRIRRVQTNEGDSSILGQFQTSASGWLWSYTEVYLNNGIKLRRMTGAEKKAQNLPAGQNFGQTIIPGKSEDFRGIIGDVERAVSAYTPSQSHRQNDPRQCLPLFRLMTWLDPYFVEGWTTGAMVVGMDYTPGATSRALEFLREGLQENPDCVDIPMMFGMIVVTRNKDLKQGERFFIRAIQNGKSRFEVLPENEMSALRSSYRWLALVYRNSGNSGKLAATVKEGLQMFPDDLVLPMTGRFSVVPPKNYKRPKGEVKAHFTSSAS
jgi:hypothetical protein